MPIPKNTTEVIEMLKRECPATVAALGTSLTHPPVAQLTLMLERLCDDLRDAEEDV